MSKVEDIFPVEDIPKKKNYHIDCDVFFREEINQEEAEKRLYRAIRNMDSTGYRGGIH